MTEASTSRGRQADAADMAGIKATTQCCTLDRTPEYHLKAEGTEYSGPDILHVFLNEEESSLTSDFFASRAVIPTRNSTSSFPQFGNLPREIRFLVWEAAVPEPEVVPRTWDAVFGYRLRRKVPSVLQACAESRRLLVTRRRERAPISASPKYQQVQMSGRKDGFVCLDWRTDSIWISRGYDISRAEIATYANLENLVMNWGLRPCWVETALEEGIRFIRQFPRLRVLSLLVDFKEHGWPEPSTLKALKRLKRNEVKRIWALVQKAFSDEQERHPGWSPPNLHIVQATPNWSRREAR